MMNTDLQRILSRAIFFLGVILGFALAVIAIWNRVEATNYFFSGAKYEPFRGLRCPLMIAPTDPGIVTTVFHNSLDEQVTFFYRTEISGRESTGQPPDQITVPPQQTKSIQMIVGADDVDLGFFIFVRINVLPNPVHRSQEAVCGIMVADILGLAGGQLPVAALSLSFLAMAVGLGIGQSAGGGEDSNLARIMQILGFMVLLTLLAGVLGWWLAGMAVSAITILLMAIFVRLAVS